MGFARLIDSHLGVSLEDTGVHARYYDAPLLLRITESLRESRLLVEGLAHQHNADGVKKGGADIEDLARSTMLSLCDILRQGALKANAGGWENRQIWSRAYSGTVQVVENYIAEVVACIECVRASPYLQAKEKLALFRQVARQQGRTALCLSGGASMGWKHLGVARCLLDEARLPRVISGTSAGALVAALLGTYTDDELRQIVRPEFAKYMTACQGSSWTKLARWITKGHYFDAVEWAPRAQVFTRGSTTFLEAFERTGKVLNISCTPVGHRYSPPKLLNYITAPNVIIWSAVLASACLPGVMQPMVLLMKTHDGRIVPYTNSGALWRDGSFRNDIPSRDLRASLNVQFTVVSQVNPHVTLFFYDRDGSIGRPPARRYSSMWRGGFVFSAIEHMLKLDIRKWLRILCDLNLVPLVLKQDWSFVWLQKFDGEITILPKARVSDYLRLLLDPTSESLKQNMEAGKVATWPKLKMIRTRQAIEDAIIGGWLEAYHECARSTRQLQAVPLWMAMEAAKMAKPAKWMYTQQKQHGQPFAEAEESHPDVWNAPTPRPKSTSPSPSQGGQAHRASRRARHYLRHSSTPPFTAPVGSRTNKHYLKLAIEGGEHGSSCSSSATEDAWTGYTC
ncbi:hypothetical protein GGF46_002895 [Coemansia sp. RSA 552]|nr:hypothetical protein GGF46_002895 [Coemansia sp. RSA 552]